jgi:protein-S-isoprenylcysteine O-methyltransferase Ste14
MTLAAAAHLILFTYLVLLVVWAATRRAAQRRFAANAPRIRIPVSSRRGAPPGSLATGAGTIVAFLVNIVTLGLVLAAGFLPEVAARLESMRIPLPSWLHVAGGVLFVLESTWGLWVLLAHPGYTPLFRRPGTELRLATRGPYAIVRHPRYVAEATLHVILFILTGLWLPLLGILAWPAVGRQARAEEAFLALAAPDLYAEYARRTGRFLPRRPAGR